MGRKGRRNKSIVGELSRSISLISLCVFIFIEVVVYELSHFSYMNSMKSELETLAQQLASITEFDSKDNLFLDVTGNAIDKSNDLNSDKNYLIIKDDINSKSIRSRDMGAYEPFIPEEIWDENLQNPQRWTASVNGRRNYFLAEYITLRSDEEIDDDDEIFKDQKNNQPHENLSETGRFSKTCLFIVGMSIELRLKQFWMFMNQISLILGMGFIVLLVTSRVAIRYGLVPLKNFKDEVGVLSLSNLKPVKVPNIRELNTVGNTLNHIIGNLETAFVRERTMRSNFAHELRTPVSEIRSLAEVALLWPEQLDEEDVNKFEDIHSSALKMQKIIERLLLLESIETDRVDITHETKRRYRA